MQAPFVDIHCHLLPGIDDGAQDWNAALTMARMAVAENIHTMIVTPHQQGNFASNLGDDIRQRTAEFQQRLIQHDIPLKVLPGGDVRIEDGMIERLLRGEVLTLADHRSHVLLELPHELYFPLERLLTMLRQHGMVGILSHPERNRGILSRPELIPPLVAQGCLMQVTAGSLLGNFGANSQQLTEWMLTQGLVHFLATDAHSPTRRRPRMQNAYQRVISLTDEKTAHLLCKDNPARVASGEAVTTHVPSHPVSHSRLRSLFTKKKAG